MKVFSGHKKAPYRALFKFSNGLFTEAETVPSVAAGLLAPTWLCPPAE